jgi:hypothetical protein
MGESTFEDLRRCPLRNLSVSVRTMATIVGEFAAGQKTSEAEFWEAWTEDEAQQSTRGTVREVAIRTSTTSMPLRAAYNRSASHLFGR